MALALLGGCLKIYQSCYFEQSEKSYHVAGAMSYHCLNIDGHEINFLKISENYKFLYSKTEGR